jgi:hypothetical protein
LAGNGILAALSTSRTHSVYATESCSARFTWPLEVWAALQLILVEAATQLQDCQSRAAVIADCQLRRMSCQFAAKQLIEPDKAAASGQLLLVTERQLPPSSLLDATGKSGGLLTKSLTMTA